MACSQRRRAGGGEGVAVLEEFDSAGEGVVQLGVMLLDAQGQREVVAGARVGAKEIAIPEIRRPAESADEHDGPHQARQMRHEVEDPAAGADAEGEQRDRADAAPAFEQASPAAAATRGDGGADSMAMSSGERQITATRSSG